MLDSLLFPGPLSFSFVVGVLYRCRERRRGEERREVVLLYLSHHHHPQERPEHYGRRQRWYTSLIRTAPEC